MDNETLHQHSNRKHSLILEFVKRQIILSDLKKKKGHKLCRCLMWSKNGLHVYAATDCRLEI